MLSDFSNHGRDYYDDKVKELTGLYQKEKKKKERWER